MHYKHVHVEHHTHVKTHHEKCGTYLKLTDHFLFRKIVFYCFHQLFKGFT